MPDNTAPETAAPKPSYAPTAFVKSPKPATSKVGKQSEPNDFLAPVAELAKDWDDEKGESKESYTVVVPTTDEDRVRRQLILAGKAIDKSVRQVWSDLPKVDKLERNATTVQKEAHKTQVEYVKTHRSVTFFPIAKITRKRTTTETETVPEVPESEALAELRGNLAAAIADLESGDETAAKRIVSIQALIDAQVLAELEPEQHSEQPETDKAAK